MEKKNERLQSLLDRSRNGKDATSDDHKTLQEEVTRLKGELKREKLRADFYEEMVAFGNDVCGIDLKKLAPSSQ